MSKFYLPIVYVEWSSIYIHEPGDLTMHPDYGFGFMPLYSSLEEMQEHYPNADYRVLEKVDRGNESVVGSNLEDVPPKE